MLGAPSLRNLLITLILLLALAGGPVVHAQQQQSPKTPEAKEAQAADAEREDILLRKTILMGFPIAAVAALIIAILATRKQHRRRLEQAKESDQSTD
jgi:heme/copper-type cytochrome/quinol oxidase subunit 2